MTSAPQHEDALMGEQHVLERHCGGRQSLCRYEIGVEQRQRVIFERDARNFGRQKRELFGGERGEPRIMRAGAQRARNDQNSWVGHCGREKI
jgi:hypothetical protein